MNEKTEIRIVAGTLRGRKVTCVVHEGLRPTPQMVREALFSILGNAVPGRMFYDLFAGTGIIGFEAISRGASRTVFVESDNRNVQSLEKYGKHFDVMPQVTITKADVYRWAERWMSTSTSPVNLFLSPPFPHLDDARRPAFIALVQMLMDKAPVESCVIVQAELGFPMKELPLAEAWDIRAYGRNELAVWVKDENYKPTTTENAVTAEES